MPVTYDDLMTRLEAHDFRLSNGRTLEEEVDRKTALTGAKARAAMREYRRFLWLAATTNGTVVPSEAVDKLWHMHLEDTRSYIDVLCGRVIGRTIHHTPGRPALHKDPAYDETLALYERHFAEVPPKKLWPQPQAIRWQRLATFPLFVSFIVGAAGVVMQEPGICLPAILVFFAMGLFWGFPVRGPSKKAMAGVRLAAAEIEWKKWLSFP